ncbi:MAG: HAMP domain-containing sensor histidine kinase, partial [Cyanobacteria bacterium J06635_1]
LDFIQSDFPKILNSMMHGAERIQTLILNLRNFTRLGEANLKAVDIHEGIDNTVLLLQNRLKPQDSTFEIKVVKAYGPLPKVECYAGSLNLVFLNILTNAVEALERQWVDRGHEPQNHPIPQITIETQAISDTVIISIADNGTGMEPAVANKIFEPFFTTKPVGKGMGLNLAISSQIVIQQHQGELDCITQPNQGTQFVIRLPLSPALKPYS